MAKKRPTSQLPQLEGSDCIPVGTIAYIERLMREGNQELASRVFDEAAVTYRLKSYEAYHLAVHLRRKTRLQEVKPCELEQSAVRS